jgi:MoaA/NifB/PqqE/SkfB family radical SAM enzyme
MSYLDLSEIRSIQIDHTSRCNLLCPQCARVDNGKVNSLVPLDELTVEDYKVIFPKEIIKNITQITQCGNYGDVIASNTILDCLDWLRTNGYNRYINVITNGSARTPAWWKELAKILGKNGKATFSIDGLKDTNHLYRVNSNWDKIVENIKAFIGAGGNARWDYLVFEHNEHQVEAAKFLAKEWGFKGFYVKKTNRFITNKNYKTNTSKTTTKKVNIATEVKYQSNFDRIVQEYGSWSNYVDITEIDCKFKKQKTLFVDFEARLWPCTWTAAPIYFAGKDNIQKIQLHKILDHYGWNFNSLRHDSLESILDHEWFKKELVESWHRTQNDEPIGKLMTCGRTCGTSYDFSSSSDNNRKLTTF